LFINDGQQLNAVLHRLFLGTAKIVFILDFQFMKYRLFSGGFEDEFFVPHL